MIWKLIYWIFWIWQLPQNVLGWLLSRNDVPVHILLGGVKVYRKDSWSFPALSLGNYMFLGKDAYGTSMSRHLFGHFLQSLRLGPLYLFLITIPALLWIVLVCKNDIMYIQFYTEAWANELSKKNK